MGLFGDTGFVNLRTTEIAEIGTIIIFTKAQLTTYTISRKRAQKGYDLNISGTCAAQSRQFIRLVLKLYVCIFLLCFSLTSICRSVCFGTALEKFAKGYLLQKQMFTFKNRVTLKYNVFVIQLHSIHFATSIIINLY